jgi:ABC-type glycerol-3-phosphate transport system permease component
MSHEHMLSDVVGWIAAGLVLATFCCKHMVSLRLVAISSNLAFVWYGALAHLWPILALHLIMLPLNVWRLRGALNDRQRQPRAPPSSVSHCSEA